MSYSLLAVVVASPVADFIISIEMKSGMPVRIDSHSPQSEDVQPKAVAAPKSERTYPPLTAWELD